MTFYENYDTSATILKSLSIVASILRAINNKQSALLVQNRDRVDFQVKK